MLRKTDWVTVPIKDLYEGLYDGPHATPKPSDSGPVFLGIKNVTDEGQLDLAEIRHIAEDDYRAWTRRVEPRPNDLVFTYEATLNRYAIIPEGFRGCLGRRMALIRPDPRKVDVRFLLYYFLGREWREVIARNTLAGSTVDRIPLTKFPEFPVRIPPLAVQHRIADTLAAYDDLVLSNLRRIKILEEAVHALYREWFVSMRWPGSEGSHSTARLPTGWSRRKLTDITSFLSRGIAPRYADDGDSVVINQKCIRDQRIDLTPSRRQSKTVPRDRLVLVGDVLINSTGVGTLGRVAQVIENMPSTTVDTHVTIVRPQDWLDKDFFGLALLERQAEFERLGVGATGQTELNRSAIGDFELLLPQSSVCAEFGKTVRPMRQLATNLMRQVAVHRELRNRLLPRLLSGQTNWDEAGRAA